MRTRRRVGVLSAALAASLALGAVLSAQSGTPLYSPVVLLYDGAMEYHGPSPNDWGEIQMREDGSGFTYYSWAWSPSPRLPAWDLTHNGQRGSRYLLGDLENGFVAPDEVPYFDCIAIREDGDLSTLRVVGASGPDGFDRRCGAEARWSVDGTRVLYWARKWQGTEIVESGLYIGEVQVDAGGAPVALADEHPVALDVPLTQTHDGFTVGGGTLSADGLRVAFAPTRMYYDATGTVRAEGLGVHVASVPRPSGGVVPPPSPAVSIGIQGGGLTFSPVAGDNRLAYIVKEAGSYYNSNIFTVSVPPGYTGSPALVPARVTPKGIVRLGLPQWSPDGAYVAYTSADKINTFSKHVWKTRSNGSGRAVRLTSEPDDYTIKAWRR